MKKMKHKNVVKFIEMFECDGWCFIVMELCEEGDLLNYIYKNRDMYYIDKDKIFVGGTSAGAHLSSQLGCLSSNKDYRELLGIKKSLPKVCGLLLINGVYNFETVGDCHFPGMSSFIWSYVGDKDYLSYERINELSTINYVDNNYPNVFITVGDRDPLRTQSYEFVDILKKNNISWKEFLMNPNIIVICDGDEYQVWKGMKNLGIVNENNIKKPI